MNAAGSDILVSIRGLAFSRGDRPILDRVDLEIRRGAITAILGPSGSGKTTLLRLIGGQLRPDSGIIEVDGQDVHKMSDRELYAMRGRLGMLVQSGALFTDLDVFENVAFPLREQTRLPEPVLRTLVLMKLQAVGLRGAHGLMPAELSGGMARRVALARALVMDPMMVMYDEPFAGQDPISMGVLMQLLRRLNDTLRLTSVVVTHDVKEASAIADHLYLISAGRVIAGGSPRDIAESGSQWVQQFMRGLPDGPVPFHYPAPTLEDDLLGWQWP